MPKSIQNDRHRTQKMEKVGVERDLAVSHEGDEMRKRVESMQKYIEVLEENLELRNTLPFHVKRLMTENEDLKAEIQKLEDEKNIATIRNNCEDSKATPASDLRILINTYKLRNVENIGDLAIFIQETKNQTLEPPYLIQINAILAHDDLKKLQEQNKLENQQLEVNGCEECVKELPKTEIMQQSLEKQLDT